MDPSDIVCALDELDETALAQALCSKYGPPPNTPIDMEVLSSTSNLQEREEEESIIEETTGPCVCVMLNSKERPCAESRPLAKIEIDTK